MAEGDLFDSLVSGLLDLSLGSAVDELTDKAADRKARRDSFEELLSRQYVTGEVSLHELLPWFAQSAGRRDLGGLRCMVAYLTPERLDALGFQAPERMPYYQYMLQFILDESKAVLAVRLINYVTVEAWLQRQLNRQGVIQVSIKQQEG